MSDVGGSCLRNSGGIVGHQDFTARTRFRSGGSGHLHDYGIYCVVYHQGAILDTLQYVTIAYFLPGAMLALLVGVFAKRILK